MDFFVANDNFESMHCPYLISTVCIAYTSTPVGWHLIWRPSACPFCMCVSLRILERVFGHSHLPWGSPMLIWNSANTYLLRGCSPLGDAIPWGIGASPEATTLSVEGHTQGWHTTRRRNQGLQSVRPQLGHVQGNKATYTHLTEH